MRRVLFLTISCLCFLGLYANDLRGVVVDSSDKSPLANATVRVLSGRDSSYVAGCMADANGNYTVGGLNRGRYLVEVSYIGYRTAYSRVSLQKAAVVADTIALQSNSIMLKETEVVGVKTEVKVMQDTVEYNAGSYKTQPNAVVEDLLKRLPGVEVDGEGKITAQGKEITKILVDGKEFFSDDAKVASKNIPVEMVDKLQVIDRKSDLARLTGVDDGEEETVINLTVKKGMKQGWFGNATAGYGTDDRYSGNFMVNRFVNDNQFSLLGNFNNINDPGFTNQGAGRFSRFMGGNGVNSAQSIGLNFNVGNEEKFRVGGDVMYSHSNNKSISSSSKQYLFSDSTSYENSSNNSTNLSHNVNGHFRMKWEVDSSNTLDFRPNFVLSFNDSEKYSKSRLRDGNLADVNSSDNSVVSSGKSYDMTGELVYNHKFSRRKGRSLSAQFSYKYSNTKEDATSYSVNEFAQKPEENETRDQYTDNHQWTSRTSMRLTWMEPIGDIKKARFLTFAYRMNYYFNNADKLVYNQDSQTEGYRAMKMLEDYGILTNQYVARAIVEDYSTLDEDLSNRFRNYQFDQEMRIGFQQNRNNYRLNGGISVNPTMMKSEDLINSARNIDSRWVWNFAPFMRFRYSFSKRKSLAVNYRGSTQSPTMQQLQPVADESDPLRVVVGNPGLLPAFRHNVSVRFNDFNDQAQRSIMAMVGTNVTTNSIVSKTIFDRETGGQTTTYDNVNGVWNANGMMMLNTPLRNKNWSFSNNVFLRYSRTVGYNNELLNRSGTFSVSETPGIAYRNGVVDVELRPNYNFQTTRNTNQTKSDRDLHTYGVSLNANYYAPFGLVLNSDINYSGTSGYSEGYDNEQWFWNASVAYQFLKGKNATVALKAYDLLGQKQNISRTVTANYIEDSESNTITRYFMLSFSYKFTVFAKGTTEKDINYDGFGRDRGRGDRRPPMDGGRPPMMPMGPPPGGF